MEKNQLLREFFRDDALNREQRFLELSARYNIQDANEILAEFKDLRDAVYTFIFTQAYPDLKLTASEIRFHSATHLKSKYSWIDENGLEGVFAWLLWMCWHEGILKKGE